MFSKYTFKKQVKIKQFMRAGILVVIDSPIGELSILGTRLTPYTEDLRLPETDLIIKTQK